LSLIRGCKMKGGFFFFFEKKMSKTTLPPTPMATKPSLGGYLSLMHVKVGTTLLLMWFRFKFVFCHLVNSIYYLINFTFNNGYWLSRFKLCNEKFIKLLFKSYFPLSLCNFNIVVIWRLSVKRIVMEWFGRWIIIDEFVFIKFANLMFKVALLKTYQLRCEIISLGTLYLKHHFCQL
jgi:hypothetical protein